MHAINSLMELERSRTAITDGPATTQKPFRLARKNSAPIVVADAATCNRKQSRRAERMERELCMRKELTLGYQDAIEGKISPARDGAVAVRTVKGRQRQ